MEKKWKKKRQSDPSENDDYSTESCEENVKSTCPHVAKAVDLPKLKKSLRTGGFHKECSECQKNNLIETSDPDFELDLSLWMCLRCGSQLCGRARNKHALNHFRTPHSDCHALTANTSSWDIYCYNCNNEVTASSSKKLHECIEYLKKQATSAVGSKLPPIELPPPPFEMLIQTNTHPKGKDKIVSVPRVRGLTNLGNTCFFNSVMQCLVQTPYLLNVLQEMTVAGENITLPGGNLKLRGVDENEGKTVELPPINGELAQGSLFTRILTETLEELQPGDGGVYNPRKILSSLVIMLPQFRGGDQHDAHELLRQLLETVRSDDLRRYQTVILNRLGMHTKVARANVDEEDKQKIKFYGQQASDTMLRPEQVFRGFLVSTLQCQECLHKSDRAENFLDLSLPVAACRPQPPALVRRKTPQEENHGQEESKSSNYQLKKNARKAGFIHFNNAAHKNKEENKSEDNSVTDETNGKNDDKSSTETDADVEDNLEEAPSQEPTAPMAHTAANFANFLMESGYNSEKLISSDSIRTSPVDEKTDSTPEKSDKDKIDLDTAFSEYKRLKETHSNPDSGVASPDATKHNSTETVDNVHSPVNGKDLGSHSSLSSETNLDLSSPQYSKLSPTKNEYEKLKISFANEYSKVVERGISVQGAKNLLESNGESYESSDKQPDSVDKVVINNKLNLHFYKLNLDIEAKNKPSYPSPTADSSNEGPPTAPRPKVDSDSEKRDFLPFPRPSRMSPRPLCDEDECSIQSCLSQFTALELLTGNNKVGCETCTERINGKDGKTVYTNATKRFLVSSPPAILILHLKRFQLGPRSFLKKLSKHVDFPTVLDLAPFCDMDKLNKLPNVVRGQNKVLYSLYGIVEHSGSMHGGHYVAYVKVRQQVKPGDSRWWFLPKGDNVQPTANGEVGNDSDSSLSGYESGEAIAPTVEPPTGKWYFVSDSMVQEVSEEKALQAQAYLLFYERIL